MNDPLSETLNRVYLPQWRAGITTLVDESTVEIPAGYGGFYVVVQGMVHLSSTASEGLSAILEAGDYGMTLLGHTYRLTQGAGRALIPFKQLLDHHDLASSGACGETRLVYGVFPLAMMGRNPFAGVLPSLIKIPVRSSQLLLETGPLLTLISFEQSSRTAGWEAAVNKLVQVLFLQTLRAHLTSQPGTPRQPNWLRAAMDPTIGPVLGLLQAQPEFAWTVNSLARATNMAKSAFSERFREVVGEPPLQYLTGYRMQKACELLVETDWGVKEIASRVGYDSPASFSNAFKRLMGKSPVDFRKGAELR